MGSNQIDRGALIQERENARTGDEILAALARIGYANSNNGALCPEDMIPTARELTEWMGSDWLFEGADQAIDRALECVRTVSEWAENPNRDPMKEMKAENAKDCAEAVFYRMAEAEATAIRNASDHPDTIQKPDYLNLRPNFHIRHTHELWVMANDILKTENLDTVPHPLATVVLAWQLRSVAGEPYILKNRASLPAMHRIPEDKGRLPELPASKEETPDQPLLPGIIVQNRISCASWLLQAYDRAGGLGARSGPAPWELHLFVGALLFLRIKDRDNRFHELRFPHLIQHEDDWYVPGTPSVERWLYPNGSKGNLRGQRWQKLPESLERLNRLGWVSSNGARIQLVAATAIPETKDTPLVELTVRVPQSAAPGARIDWPTLCRYRVESAVAYRAYLSACAMIGNSARRGHGITAEIKKPLLKPDGKPMRKSGGKIVRGDELIPNPPARYAPVLKAHDLTSLIGMDPNNRLHRHRAVNAFENLSDDGVIDLRKQPDGWKIFKPR